MQKDCVTLANEIFDVVIVGAGIHGATLALDAAKSGYRVALLDKGDFGSATSANSLKIIHGGIRYLQHGDFCRMRESIVSRRAMMRFAPHLVRPLACMMPTFGHGLRGREIMRLAFGVYDIIAADRNRGIPTYNHLPCSTSVAPQEVAWAVPGIDQQGLTGGAVWYDAIADNTERLILEYVKEAQRYGAVVANYIQASELRTNNGRVTGVIVKDLQDDGAFPISCRAVVNAAGPWLSGLTAGGASQQLWASAVNIVVRKKLFQKYAVGLEGYTEFTDKDALIKRGKRLFFFVPWLDKYTMIGTSYKPYSGNPDNFRVSRDELAELLDDINKIYPSGNLTLDDVSYYHGGLLPMNEADDSKADSVQLDKSSVIIDHGEEKNGPFGLFSIKGVKYTTAPDIAQKVIRLLSKPHNLGSRKPGCYGEYAGEKSDFGTLMNVLGEQFNYIRSHLGKRYGTAWREVFRQMVGEYEKDPAATLEDLWLINTPKLLKAELLYFIRKEMAVQLTDVVFRRSEIASAECPDTLTLQVLADCMGDELNWSADKRRQQIELVRCVFAPLQSPSFNE